MEKPKAKIDSFEPVNEDQGFVCPIGKESPKIISPRNIRKNLPKLIKAFEEGFKKGISKE